MKCAKSRVSCNWCERLSGCEIFNAYKELRKVIERLKVAAETPG